MTKTQTPSKKICFVIMPFSDPDGYEKGHFKKIYEQIFKPAIELAGYEAHRVDENNESTLIQGKLLDQLVSAPMVLCDLSSKNPNVLYELGIRHAFDKPVVLVQEAGQAHIFDVAGISTVEYRKSRLYDEVVEDQKRICSAIQETADTKKNYSIMSLAKLAHATISSEDSFSNEDRIEILIRDMSQRFVKLEERFSAMTSPAPTNLWNTDAFEKNRIKARVELERAIDKVEAAMKKSNQEEMDESDDFAVLLNRLREAQRNYRVYLSVRAHDDLFNRSQQLLISNHSDTL